MFSSVKFGQLVFAAAPVFSRDLSLRKVPAACAASLGLLGVGSSAWPPPRSICPEKLLGAPAPGFRFNSSQACDSPAGLRPFNSLDIEACRRVRTGKHIGPQNNPGIRIESSFLSQEEVSPLLKELESLKSRFGFTTAGHNLAVLSRGRSAEGLATSTGTAVSDSSCGTGDRDAGSFDSSRVTGRPEGQDALAPWGYGNDFDLSSVPPKLSSLVRQIRDCSSSSLGALRDITVNYRGNHFFRLDPHLDPVDDGEHVFILGLLSDVVLTFVPPEGQPPSGVPRRNNAVEVARNSWTDKDIDVLLQQRSLVHFTAKARSQWHHAIRGGLEVETDDGPVVVDWWGKQDFYVRRSKERVSVVVAFEGENTRN